MGVGLGYAIAAYAAYNFDHAYPRVLQDPLCELAGKGEKKRKKIVCLEGDSALGFSGMEIETMARYRMPILVIVMNNSGIYHGDTADPERWRELQGVTVAKQRRDGWVDPNGESNVQEAKGGGNWKGKGGPTIDVPPPRDALRSPGHYGWRTRLPRPDRSRINPRG